MQWASLPSWPTAAAASVLAVLLTAAPGPAHAADGCTVLLCLAGNWRSIGQCVPPVRKALRDLALGRSFPVCGFASAPSWSIGTPGTAGLPSATGSPSPTATTASVPSQATLRWADAEFCPPQYRVSVEGESATQYSCAYTGAIEVTIAGQLWNRTWWSMTGDSVTEWTAAARAAVPQSPADGQFERDYEAWRLQQSTTQTPPSTAPEGGA